MPAGGIYSVLDNSRLNARSDFFAGLGAGIDGSWAGSLGTLIMSDTEQENYAWIGTSPQLSVLEGEVLLSELPNYTATLKNIPYASGLKINKDDLRRDKTGQISTRMTGLGRRTATHWETLASTLIANGETATAVSGNTLSGAAYDTRAFFATNHTYANSSFTTSQSNLLSSGNFDVTTATAPTVAEATKFCLDMIMNFYTLKDDQGEPINGDARSFTFMVGTAALAAPIATALTSQFITSGETNALVGVGRSMGISANVILNPRLSAKTTKVYCFRNDGDIRPFIFQEEVPVDVVEEDPGVTKNYIHVVAKAVRAAGYGLWQGACAATLS